MSADNEYRYLVGLPLVGGTVHVRGLLVGEEDKIKSSVTSQKHLYDTLFRTVYDCIDPESKAKRFKTYEEFLSNMTPPDRDSLLFGIIIQSYDDTNEVSMTCSSCSHQFPYQFNIPSSMDIKPYDGEEPILNKRVSLEFPEYNWKMILKQPTLKDEYMTLAGNRENKSLVNSGAYIIVDSLEFEVTNDLKKPNGRATMHLPFEIYGAISQKPAKVRKKIFKEWNDVFGNYGISCMAETICPSCG